VDGWDTASPSERARRIGAAKWMAGRAGRSIALDTLQLHGAVGFQDETAISHYARRLAANDALLADYGAEVLKVELPGGDGCRSFPPHEDGKPLWWKATNRNKQLISLDLRKPQGVALLKRLLPRFGSKLLNTITSAEIAKYLAAQQNPDLSDEEKIKAAIKLLPEIPDSSIVSA